jgi:hypothetical protein
VKFPQETPAAPGGHADRARASELLQSNLGTLTTDATRKGAAESKAEIVRGKCNPIRAFECSEPLRSPR